MSAAGAFFIPKGAKQMIEIEIEKGKIAVKGHAGYDEIGKDIVCAAVSTLFQALIASVKELTPDTYDPGTFLPYVCGCSYSC